MIRPEIVFAISLLGLVSSCTTTPKSCLGLGPVRYTGLEDANGDFANVTPIYPPGESVIARLRCRSDSGEREAQVALARRYETGDGVEVDLPRAAKLYQIAATAIPSKTAIYSPPVTLKGQGRVMFYDNPNASPGSAEAKHRLGQMYLDGRGVARDVERGQELITYAIRLGYRNPDSGAK